MNRHTLVIGPDDPQPIPIPWPTPCWCQVTHLSSARVRTPFGEGGWATHYASDRSTRTARFVLAPGEANRGLYVDGLVTLTFIQEIHHV